ERSTVRVALGTVSHAPRQAVFEIEALRPGWLHRGRAFAYPVSDEKIRFLALFSPDAAMHLPESLLAADQVLTNQDDGRELVKATMLDTAELRWWLLGFGS